MLFFLIAVLIFIGYELSPIFQKENINDISFSDFRSSIGPFLTFIAVYISYRTEIKKERNTKNQNNSSL